MRALASKLALSLQVFRGMRNSAETPGEVVYSNLVDNASKRIIQIFTCVDTQNGTMRFIFNANVGLISALIGTEACDATCLEPEGRASIRTT